MRVTFLLPNDSLSGGNRVAASHAKHLQRRGHQVTIVCRRPGRRSARGLVKTMLRDGLGAALHCLRDSPPGHASLSGVPVRWLAHDRRPTPADLPDADAIVATWWETVEWIADMPRQKGRQFHLIQGYEVWGGNEADVHRALSRDNTKIAISQSLRADIQRVIGQREVHVVTNGIDATVFKAPPRPRNPVPRVGFVYAADPMKGSDRCRESIAIARQSLPSLQAIAFGVSPPSKQNPLPPECEYVLNPSQDRIPSLYAACDAWLFASRLDSFGLPILEAMSCRTPVIGVRTGAAPELLSAGHGMLIDAASEPQLVAALAGALVSIGTMPEQEWRSLSDRAHAKSATFSWHRAAAAFERILLGTPATREECV
jgi:glycosyltransferase involved in cell wall biosynthesis